MSNDFVNLIGDVKIQIPYANNIAKVKDLKQLWVRVRLMGAYEPSVFKSILLLD